MTDTSSPGFAYTLGTGRLFTSFAEFHKQVETLMGRPIYTHEFADNQLWQDMREAYEKLLLNELKESDD